MDYMEPIIRAYETEHIQQCQHRWQISHETFSQKNSKILIINIYIITCLQRNDERTMTDTSQMLARNLYFYISNK